MLMLHYPSSMAADPAIRLAHVVHWLSLVLLVMSCVGMGIFVLMYWFGVDVTPQGEAPFLFLGLIWQNTCLYALWRHPRCWPAWGLLGLFVLHVTSLFIVGAWRQLLLAIPQGCFLLLLVVQVFRWHRLQRTSASSTP